MLFGGVGYVNGSTDEVMKIKKVLEEIEEMKEVESRYFEAKHMKEQESLSLSLDSHEESKGHTI